MAWCWAIALFVAVPAAAAPDHAFVLQLARSIVKVEVAIEGGRFYLGTGTVVARERVVTACHVTQRAVRIHVLYGGLRLPVARQRADMAHDLCLLMVPDLEAGPVEVGRSDRLHIGETVVAIGFTGGAGLSPAIGTVEGLHRVDGAQVVQSDAGFSSGASGGGMFDERGTLVAILLFRMRGPGPQFFAVPVEWFGDWIARTDAYESIVPLSGAPFWARQAEALPNFMRANTLEAEARWADLKAFADRWAADDATNPDAAFWQGFAASRLNRDDTAIAAFERAVQLDRRHARAWYHLGRTFLHAGRAADARAVVPALLAASEPLARRLIDAIPDLPD
jgi:serine protease Do